MFESNGPSSQRHRAWEENDGTGQRLGRYVLHKRLARGGMAEVYAAELVVAGVRKRVAVKRMHRHLVDSQTHLPMFIEEARVGLRLSHPNICAVLELGEVEDEYFIAMEYVHGVTLGTLLGVCTRQGRHLPISVVAGIIAQACEGLHYAHEHRNQQGRPLRLIHRDVSPQNLMVCDHGGVKVLDFGISKVDDSCILTTEGALKGKDCYMSPEQLYGLELDRRADIWSLGVVLFECLAGMRLFRRSSLPQLLSAITRDPIPSVRDLRPDVPERLSQVVSKALCRERKWRFNSAEDMRLALLSAVGANGLAPSATIGELVRSTCAPILQERDRIFDDASRDASHHADRPQSLVVRRNESREPTYSSAQDSVVVDMSRALHSTRPEFQMAVDPAIPTLSARGTHPDVSDAPHGSGRALRFMARSGLLILVGLFALIGLEMFGVLPETLPVSDTSALRMSDAAPRSDGMATTPSPPSIGPRTPPRARTKADPVPALMSLAETDAPEKQLTSVVGPTAQVASLNAPKSAALSDKSPATASAFSSLREQRATPGPSGSRTPRRMLKQKRVRPRLSAKRPRYRNDTAPRPAR